MVVGGMIGDGGHIVPGCSGVGGIVLAHQHLDAGDSVAVGAVGGLDHVLGRDLGVELETKVAEDYNHRKGPSFQALAATLVTLHHAGYSACR